MASTASCIGVVRQALEGIKIRPATSHLFLASVAADRPGLSSRRLTVHHRPSESRPCSAESLMRARLDSIDWKILKELQPGFPRWIEATRPKAAETLA